MRDTIERLYREDERFVTDWKEKYTLKDIKKRNKGIRRRLEELIERRPLKTAKDHYLAAHIYQHGFTIASSKKALACAKRSVALGNKKGRWLIAAATDRLLQLQGKPQTFGTQPIDMDAPKLRQYRTDKRTTDEQRKQYGLPSLRELRRNIES